ncbi:MAG: TIGR00153 family protein [Xanthomonadales bacterium]|nr:TIGR00153 family protein [Xanthomonadales bacterium]
MPGSYLSGIFGASPVKPLQTHMERVVACVSELPAFIEAVMRGDTDERDRIHQRVIDLEHEGDALKKQLRLKLPSSLFMPVDRRDVLEVLAMQDRVAGAARGVCGLIVGRDMQFPERLADDYQLLVTRCADACQQAFRAINELDELIETSFGEQERELVGGLLAELDAIESHTDEIQVRLSHALFAIEDQLPPVHVMFLYRVFDRTGAIADRAQRVGSRLQLMLAR